MIRQLPSNISSNELDLLFTDERLVKAVRERLGVLESYAKEQVLTTAFIFILSNNCVFDDDKVCDKFLRDAISYAYSCKSISRELQSKLVVKINTLSLLLDMLLKCNCDNRYINLVAWHLKYTNVLHNIMGAIDKFGYGIKSDAILKYIPIINSHIIKEFGSVSPNLMIHILLQLCGCKYCVTTHIGAQLSSNIIIDNTMVAKEGSIVTFDLECLLRSFGMEDIPIKANSNEANYLMKDDVILRPMQMRILQGLTYRDKIIVIKDRLSKLMDKPEYSQYIDTVKQLGSFEWQHAYNVAVLCGLTAINLKIGPVEFDRVLMGALLHDIGKSKLDSNIIRAERALTKEEREHIMKHPSYGKVIVSELSITVNNMVAYHHENEDGTGYPNGSKNISTSAAICHIADVYDAMSRQRDYKKPYDRSVVLEYIKDNDKSFNREIKKIFLNTIKIFMPGEVIYLAGIPCTFYDYKDGGYMFHIESINRFVKLSDEEVFTQIAWQNSVLN